MGKLSFRLGIGGTSDMLGNFSRTRRSQGSMSNSKQEACKPIVYLLFLVVSFCG